MLSMCCYVIFGVWIEDYVSGFGWLCGVVWRLLSSEFPATLGWSAHRSILAEFRARARGRTGSEPNAGLRCAGYLPPRFTRSIC